MFCELLPNYKWSRPADGSTYLLVSLQPNQGETSWKKLAAFVTGELV